MHRNDKLLVMVVSAAIFQSSLLLTTAITAMANKRDARTYHALLNYYAAKLNDNDIPLTEFDVVAVHTIIETGGSIFDQE